MSAENPLTIPDFKSEAERKARRAEAQKAYYWRNREAQIQKLAERRRLHPDKINRYRSNWANKNKARDRAAHTAWRARKIKEDPAFRIKNNVSRRLHHAMTSAGRRKTMRGVEYVGCSWEQLRSHIESQFKKGMTWANYGPEWHIDHIVPCALFDLSKPEEARRCFHFTNLRPLWAIENCRRQHRVGTVQYALGEL